MKIIGLVRLGRDAETRYTPSGQVVTSFSAAFNHGRRDSEGRQPTQWVEFALWGERGEKVVEFLKKGTSIVVCASDPHVEEYEKRDGGVGVKLVARLDDFEFAARPEGERADARPPAAAPAPAPRPAAPKPAPKTGGGFDDMDDDIPF